MRVSRAAVLVLTMAALTASVPASACINDEITEQAEYQFYSRYYRNNATDPAPAPPLRALGLITSGLGLCTVIGSILILGIDSIRESRAQAKRDLEEGITWL